MIFLEKKKLTVEDYLNENKKTLYKTKNTHPVGDKDIIYYLDSYSDIKNSFILFRLDPVGLDQVKDLLDKEELDHTEKGYIKSKANDGMNSSYQKYEDGEIKHFKKKMVPGSIPEIVEKFYSYHNSKLPTQGGRKTKRRKSKRRKTSRAKKSKKRANKKGRKTRK
jgi:hypothetical protein